MKRLLLILLGVLGAVPVATGLLAIVVAGGVARVISVIAVGWPHPVYIGAMAVELVVVPLLIVWHARQYPIRPVSG
ncbi:DUF4345 domain-containing protein [Glaciihabitans arcticus]|uniref:DUF4345 domain-containing protein n=1 Tax=Glaciihabitans arcticus TaxID=2668039 RepID=A0A4Q9GS30_9MICO|nr:DUF4345 family protein [Glaciihabitans arcticus]TBN57375.1 DUF4345 domain-containing protein [Glaciihabitans arcticus]